MLAILAGACTGQTATPTRTAGPSAAATVSPPSVTPRPAFPFPPPQSSGANPYTAAGGPFAYYQKAPFSIVENGVDDQGDLAVHDIGYLGAAGEPVEANLVYPKGNVPFGAVVFQHGSGDNRLSFLEAAQKLARLGSDRPSAVRQSDR